MIRIFSLLCFLCLSAIYGQNLKGQFVGDEYRDPNNLFSVKVSPVKYPQVTEHASDYFAAVIFQNDFGGVLRFEVSVIPDSELSPMMSLIKNDPDAFKKHLISCCFTDIFAQSPNTIIMHEETILNNSEREWYFFLKIPGGSTLMNTSTGKREDSLRGFLIFLKGNQVVFESLQHSQIALDSFKMDQQKDDELFKNTLRLLQEHRKDYRNLTCKK